MNTSEYRKYKEASILYLFLILTRWKDDNMYKTVGKILKDIKNKVTPEEYVSFEELFSEYDGAMRCLENKSKDAFNLFDDWFSGEGKDIFDDIISRILKDKLDSRVQAFSEIYKSFLADSISENNDQIILEFLYKIPRKMKEDFEDFGFLQADNIKCKLSKKND